jgi:hypothetical protein
MTSRTDSVKKFKCLIIYERTNLGTKDIWTRQSFIP